MSVDEREFYFSRLGKDFVFPGYSPKYARDKLYRIRHVKFEGELEYHSKTLKAECTLSIELIEESTSSIKIDGVNFVIHGVWVDGNSCDFYYDGKQITIEAPKKKQFEVRISYSVTNPQKGLFIITPDEHYPNKPYQAWTQGESEDNRYWLPVYDYPNMKCTSELSLIVPKEQFVVSNGVLVKEEEVDQKRKRYHWLMDQPHSTYLISFCAGEFDVLKEEWDGIPLLYVVPKGRASDAPRSFSKTRDMMSFFSEFTGVKYPYKKYAQTCVYDFTYGGMENITATTLTERTLHDEIAHLDFSSDPLVAHELAHQWFGDLVTCRDWSHIWLNESFATFFQALYLRRDKGVEEFYYDLVTKLDSYLEEASKRYVRPISTKFYSLPEEVFDRHAYEKGSLVLNSLMNLVGEQNFKRAINRYLELYKFSNAETDDLRKCFEEVTGRNLEWFFDERVYRAGHPELSVSYSYEDSQTLKITFEQKQTDVGVFTLPLKVRAVFDSRDEWFSFVVEEKRQTFFVRLSERPKYVCVDPEMSVVGALNIEEDLRSKLLKAKQDPHVYCRVLAIRSLTKHKTDEVVDALREIVLSNAFWGVCAEAARALGNIGGERALNALIEASKHADPKVRRAVAQALGEFKRERKAFDALVSLLKSDVSYYVRGAAAQSLGQTKIEQAYDFLVEALRYPSHKEVIASSALTGLGELALEKCVPVSLEKTKLGEPEMVRRAATLALSNYTGNPKVEERIKELCKDKDYAVRINALKVIEKSADRRFLEVVEQVASSDTDGRVVRVAREVKRKLELGAQDQIKELREELEKISKENAKLREELESLKSIARSKQL
jgi:aminopeptidase N